VADKNMENFILSNLTKIGAANVEVTPIDLTALQEKEEKVKEINATVAAFAV